MKSRHVNLHDDFAAVCKIIDHNGRLFRLPLSPSELTEKGAFDTIIIMLS